MCDLNNLDPLKMLKSFKVPNSLGGDNQQTLIY